MVRKILCTLIVLAAMLVTPWGLPLSGSAEERPAFWRSIADDLETGETTVTTRVLFSSHLTFFRTSLRKYRIGVVRASAYGWRRTDVKTLCKASKALVCINSNFFDEQGNPLGLIVSKGILLQKMHRGGTALTGIFQAGRRDISIVNRQSYTGEDALEAIQAGPRLLSGSSPVPGVRESLTPSRRSGICIDRNKNLVVYAVSSRFIGLNVGEIQNVLLRPEIGCVDALNLDGGGSTQLYVSGKLPGGEEQQKEFYIAGEDEVPVVLGLFPRS